MISRTSIRWAALPIMAALVALVAFMGSGSDVTKAAPGDAMSAVGPGVGVGVGSSFDAAVNIDEADTGYQGYQAYLSWDPLILSYNSTTYTGIGGTSLDATPVVVAGGVQIGSARISGTSNETGKAADINLTCDAAGTSALHLVTLVEDPSFGTTQLAVGGGIITTGLTDGSVSCEVQADLSLIKEASSPVIAGGLLTYTLTVHNAGPEMAKGVVIGDDLPDDKVFVSAGADVDGDTVPDLPCLYLASYPLDEDGDTLIDEDDLDTVDNDGDTLVDEDPPNNNIVQCVIDGPLTGLPGVMPSQTITVIIVVEVPLEAAGKLELNTAAVFTTDVGGVAEPTTDPNPANDSGYVLSQVEPADITLSKSADRDPAIYSEGEQITWTVTAASNGPSPASAIVLTDTVGPNQAIVSADVSAGTCSETGTSAAQVVGQDVTCSSDQVVAAGGSLDLVVVTDVIGSDGNECVNDAGVEWADPLTASTSATAICLPPTTRMEKDLDEDSTLIVDATNLFLEIDPSSGDLMCIDIYELVSNADNDPDGVGAYEFQLKFDHKIFDIEINDTSWLSNGGTREVTCEMSILTENWILFGCVSTGPTPGQTADGTAAVITVCPEPDLIHRLTPGNDNGIFRMLLDENCELADVLGHPLEAADWCCDGLDNDGDTVIDEFGEGLAPGVGPGGMLDTCSDMAVTVRILEGDLNLDCVVDVLDQQAIAFRYGMTFGLTLYDPWYDLEPNVKDFDIDIKDLQKVFGRDGSTCDNPIPAQDPLPPPPW